MSSAEKNILLVGGAGYLGSHLGKHLSSHSVFYTSRTKKENVIELDLLNKETFKNINGRSYDCIILLASSLKGLGTTELKAEFLDTDTAGLSAFLQYISENKLTGKLIYISSMTVYGTENMLPVNESAATVPISTYGLSKMLAEKIIDFFCNTHPVHGVILRIPGIYGGDRKSGFIYNTALKCIKDQPVELDTSSLGYWETINVDDLCDWIGQFIENYDWIKKSDIFNISYGIKTDFIECARFIKETLRSSSEITLKGNKGYADLYLDNSKVKKYAAVKDKYKESLVNYLNTLEA